MRHNGGRAAALTLLLLLAWAALEAGCSGARPAIIGGRDAEPGRYRFFASLRMIYRRWNGELADTFCGGETLVWRGRQRAAAQAAPTEPAPD